MNSYELNFKQKIGVDFNKFYRENKPKLIWYITKWTNSREMSEDIADEAFMQALRKLDLYQEDRSKIHTWLYTIAINIVKKDFAEKKRMMTHSIDKTMGENSDMKMFLPQHDGKKDEEYLIETNKKAELVKDAIYNLPKKYEKYKRVLIMREIENLTYDEISEHLCINLSTIKSQIKKGREIVANKMGPKMKRINESGLTSIVYH